VTDALVEVDGVHHLYGDAVALAGVSLTIAPGAYTVLLGPSGSGKTTLLSILGGFVVPTKGRVLIDGMDCTRLGPQRRPTATVFQDYALFPHMTVESNVGFGLMMRGIGRRERRDRVAAALALVGLEGLAGKRPHQLSGGQRQRVALARALVVEPAVLLLDEPLGALDLKLRRQMQDELKSLQHRVGTAFVHVTHDQEEAMALADHCVVMNRGRIEDDGPPERVYARPASRFTASFMGDSTALEATVIAAAAGSMLVSTSLGDFHIAAEAPLGAAILLSLRPEHLHLGAPRKALHLGDAEVTGVVFQGSFRRVTAVSQRDPKLQFEAKIPPGQAIAVGMRLAISCDPDNVIVTTR
jgi:spermidine/putrescine transport system ATP-binding protein